MTPFPFPLLRVAGKSFASLLATFNFWWSSWHGFGGICDFQKTHLWKLDQKWSQTRLSWEYRLHRAEKPWQQLGQRKSWWTLMRFFLRIMFLPQIVVLDISGKHIILAVVELVRANSIDCAKWGVREWKFDCRRAKYRLLPSSFFSLGLLQSYIHAWWRSGNWSKIRVNCWFRYCCMSSKTNASIGGVLVWYNQARNSQIKFWHAK